MSDKPISRTETVESVPLLPCPFCGGEAKRSEETYGVTLMSWVYCTSCGAQGAPRHIEAEAIEAWNTRVEWTCKNVCKEWEKTSFAHAGTSFCCSECGAHYVDCECYYAALADADEEHIRTNYCPNCGAFFKEYDEARSDA